MTSILGKTFSSYSELKAWIKDYEESHFIQFYKSSSRTIEGARKKGVKRFIKEELVYSEITYSCIHSGKHTSRTTGQRPNQSTYRQGCEANIRFKASSDGHSLEVVFYKDNHNHELNKVWRDLKLKVRCKAARIQENGALKQDSENVNAEFLTDREKRVLSMIELDTSNQENEQIEDILLEDSKEDIPIFTIEDNDSRHLTGVKDEQQSNITPNHQPIRKKRARRTNRRPYLKETLQLLNKQMELQTSTLNQQTVIMSEIASSLQLIAGALQNNHHRNESS